MSAFSPEWIDLPTAARRSGKSVGHLRRLCQDKWALADHAEQRRPKLGGKAEWFVQEAADAAFARVRFADQIGTDLRAYPEEKRRVAYRRLTILERWHKHCAAAFELGYGRVRATNNFAEQLLLKENLRLSSKTLYNWERSYKNEGLAGLLDFRGTKGSDDPDDDDPFFAEVRKLWLVQGKPKLTACHEMACMTARANGWRIRGYKWCQRQIEKKIPPAVILKMRGGEEAFVNHAEPYLEGDYTTLESNELWNADHHQFDVLITVSERLDSSSGEIIKRHVRPWVTAFQDLRSRKIVGWKVYAHDPNSDVILTVFRDAILDHGVPWGLLIDNGKDFDCKDFHGRTKKDRWRNRKVRVDLDVRATGLFAALNVDAQHAKPYHGQSKPIERWFNTVETRTCFWPTYCGNAPHNRPEDLQLQLERGKAPTLQEFAEWFDAWVVAFNAGHEHQGQGMNGQTPDVVFAANFHSSIRTAPRELVNLIAMKTVEGTVGQNGVTFNGLRYGQYEPALHALLGKKVTLRIDERDVTSVQVYQPNDGPFVCLAAANQQMPKNADAQMLRAALRDKATSRRVLKDFVTQRPRLAESVPDRMLRTAQAKAAVKRAEAPTPPNPPGYKPLRHPLEDVLPHLRRAMDRRSNTARIAVGAESFSLADLGNAISTSNETSDDGGGDAVGGDVGGDTFGQIGRALRGKHYE